MNSLKLNHKKINMYFNKKVNDKIAFEQLTIESVVNDELFNFYANIYFPLKGKNSVCSANVPNQWIQLNNELIEYPHQMIWNLYCENNSNNRIGSEIIFDRCFEVDERQRFAKSFLVGIKYLPNPNLYHGSFVGGAWIEKYNHKEKSQQFHLFVKKEFEGFGLGKMIEPLIVHFLTHKNTKNLSCMWNKNYTRPEKFFKKLGYLVNPGHALKSLSNNSLDSFLK